METLEGNKYCITGNTKTFYVNSSSGDRLDPKPSKNAAESTTLIELLQKISSKFKSGIIMIVYGTLSYKGQFVYLLCS